VAKVQNNLDFSGGSDPDLGIV